MVNFLRYEIFGVPTFFFKERWVNTGVKGSQVPTPYLLLLPFSDRLEPKKEGREAGTFPCVNPFLSSL